MRIKLFLPFYPVGEFANDREEISDEQYADMLNSYYNSAYFKFMNDVLAGRFDGRYNMQDIIPEQYQIKSVKEKKTPARYYSFDALLNDIDDRPVDVSFFMNPRNFDEMNAFIIHILIPEENNEDALSELALWTRESKEIMRDPRIDEDHKIAILPQKDLKVGISENTNNIRYESIFKLVSCRIPDLDDKQNFAIIVNKIERA